MSDSLDRNSAPADEASTSTVRIAEVVAEVSPVDPWPSSHDFREAVVPAACAADAVNITITANKGGEPKLALSPPPGVKVNTKDGTD